MMKREFESVGVSLVGYGMSGSSLHPPLVAVPHTTRHDIDLGDRPAGFGS